MRRGLSNAWTQKSLDRLAALKPDTYARPRSAADSSDRSSGMSINRRRVWLKQPSAIRRKPRPRRQRPPGRRTACRTDPHSGEQVMQTRTDLERTTGARRVAAGLVLAVALLGCWTTASAGTPRWADRRFSRMQVASSSLKNCASPRRSCRLRQRDAPSGGEAIRSGNRVAA